MAKMRAIMPRVEALKERYGEDRQAFAMAQMDLYKKEGVNPIGGCLPILIPLPIFFALYWVLLETVELRHAPWLGWIQNLTAPDPYFILPALNMAVMFLTQKMTPTPGMDPVQKKMMNAMPLIFGVMMAFFPAGLVLYWVTNGILGIAQQWWITRQHGTKPAVAH
jgi:YidC/Oxa1 family membrane protein insertase